jgi:CheY-like chemotaxis protein
MASKWELVVLARENKNVSSGRLRENRVAMRESKILVVEDDDDIRDSLKELLEEEGYRVDTAPNGEQALAKLRDQELPQLILLDLMMPVMDGWQFQKELRRIPSYASLPIIVISASKFSREPLNAAAFIPKPLDAGVLLETIESFLTGSATELEAR